MTVKQTSTPLQDRGLRGKLYSAFARSWKGIWSVKSIIVVHFLWLEKSWVIQATIMLVSHLPLHSSISWRSFWKKFVSFSKRSIGMGLESSNGDIIRNPKVASCQFFILFWKNYRWNWRFQNLSLPSPVIFIFPYLLLFPLNPPPPFLCHYRRGPQSVGQGEMFGRVWCGPVQPPWGTGREHYPALLPALLQPAPSCGSDPSLRSRPRPGHGSAPSPCPSPSLGPWLQLCSWPWPQTQPQLQPPYSCACFPLPPGDRSPLLVLAPGGGADGVRGGSDPEKFGDHSIRVMLCVTLFLIYCCTITAPKKVRF